MNEYYVGNGLSASPALAHYGVLGMRWGVRKNPEKAVSKASKKLRRYHSRVQKYTKKADKLYAKSDRKSSGLFKNEEAAAKARERADKYHKMARIQLQKGHKWYTKMEKILSQKNGVKLPSDVVSMGEAMAAMIFASNASLYAKR